MRTGTINGEKIRIISEKYSTVGGIHIMLVYSYRKCFLEWVPYSEVKIDFTLWEKFLKLFKYGSSKIQSRR